MKKKLIAIIILIVGCSHSPMARNVATDPSFDIKTTVKNIVERGLPYRTVGTEGHKKVQEYISDEFKKIAVANGGKFFVHEFLPDVEFAARTYQSDFDTQVAKKFKPIDPVYKKWDKFTKAAKKFVRSYKKIKGYNLILEIPGSESQNEVLYVGAHYDSITHNHDTMTFTPDSPAPGADDNASGVAALLESAKILAASKPKKTLRFVAFDYEEIFFLGSYAYAKELKSKTSEKFLGLINLEMIGWSSKKLSEKPVLKIYTRNKKEPSSVDDMKLAQSMVEARPHTSLDPVILPNGFDRSDNWSFWKNDFSSITLSQDWEKDFNEKNYHTPQDIPENLNFPYLEEITQFLIAGVSKLVNIPLALQSQNK